MDFPAKVRRRRIKMKRKKREIMNSMKEKAVKILMLICMPKSVEYDVRSECTREGNGFWC